MTENPYAPPLETNDAVVETRPSVPWRQLAIIQLTLIIVVLLYLIKQPERIQLKTCFYGFVRPSGQGE